MNFVVELVPPELSPYPERFPDFVKHFARRHYEVFGDRLTRVVGRGEGPVVVVMAEIDGKTGRHRIPVGVLDADVEGWDEILVVMVAMVQRNLELIADEEDDGPRPEAS
jgi:hypothetical protein